MLDVELDKVEKITVYIKINYQGAKWIDDREAYLLQTIYPQFENQAKIICFHGENDDFISIGEKEIFVQSVANTSMHIVKDKEADGTIFSSTRHGLGADFLKLFYYVCERDSLRRSVSQKDLWKSVDFMTSEYYYYTMLENGVPVIRRQKR